MADRNHKNNPKSLQQLIRSEIIQPYPPQTALLEGIKIDWDMNSVEKPDPIDVFMRDNDIVEDYIGFQEPPRRSLFSINQHINSGRENSKPHSRHSSISSRGNLGLQRENSLEKLPFLMKNYNDDMMDEEVNPGNFQVGINNKMQMEDQRFEYFKPPMNHGIQNHSFIAQQIFLTKREKEKNQKISKLRQVGCNCRKSKCLKMYCECFNLQIFCGDNCNCINCGNSQPNAGHHQAVIEALTRNPKAFQDEKPKAEGGFNLGVGLNEVRKGCKCKKTKCLKKYCECFASGLACGRFCKCENCQNVK